MDPQAAEKLGIKPFDAAAVVTQRRETHIAPVAKRSSKSKVAQPRCEAIVQRAQLGTQLGNEDKAFLKRDC